MAVLALFAALDTGGARAQMGPTTAADCKSSKVLVRIESCTMAIQQNSKDVAAYVRRGDAYRRVAGSDEPLHDELAIADYTAALRIEPGRSDALFGRAQAHEDARQFQLAIADYSEVLRQRPKFSDGFFRRGVTYFRSGDCEHAMPDLKEAARLSPNWVYALHLRGDCYRLKGDYRHAISEYSEEFRRQEPPPQERKDRAMAYLLSGDNDRAIADFTGISKDWVLAATGLYGRGIARLRKGDIKNGRADIAAALARSPQEAERFAREGIMPPP